MAWFSAAASNRRRKARQLQKEAKLATKERKRQEKIGLKDVNYFKPRLVKACSQQGMMYILRPIMRPDAFDVIFLGKSPIQRVKFSHVFFDETRIWFRINSLELPYMTSILDFMTEGFLATVSDALGREIKCYRSPKSGTWIVIERDGSTAGIPEYVRMQDALDAIPADADELTVMLGMGEHGVWQFGSLTDWQHLLIAGQTNSGKSVWMNSAIVTLFLRNTPDRLMFMMIDLKNGVELGPYKKLPHLWRPIARKPEEVEAALNEFIAEMNRRGDMFEAAGVRNLQEWNRKFPDQKLPFIVLVIDELSRLLLNSDSKIKKTSKHLLNDVLATARAYGMHAFACTQDPASEVVPRWLKTNLPGKLCFSMPSISASITVLGNKGAHKLGVKGRFVFQFDEDIKVQGPYIGTDGITRAVKFAIKEEAKRNKGDEKPKVQLIDVLRHCHEQQDDRLSLTHVVHQFRSQVGERQIRDWLKEADDQVFELGPGEWFQVQNNTGRQGRRLIPVPAPDQAHESTLMAAD
jgi:hypothetical protein